MLKIISFNIEGITLENRFLNDHSLENYIIQKNKILNNYLNNADVDLIGIQEFSPIFIIKSDKYCSVVKSRYVLLFDKNKFEYLGHDPEFEHLVVYLKWNNTIISVCVHRLPNTYQNIQKRKKMLKELDCFAKNKNCIVMIDTNMRGSEYCKLSNMRDCYLSASVKEGSFTIDKINNPYFASDCNASYRYRYDKIFVSKNFKCNKFTVLNPCNELDHHPMYPYGSLSDHYPIQSHITLK